MRKTVIALVGLMLSTSFLGGEIFAQNRERRDEKTRDYHVEKNEFRTPRRRGQEQRLPIVIQRFRTIDGSQNNLSNENWGQTGSNLRRRVPSAYADGVSAPSGFDRPNPRLISNLICNQDVDFIGNDRGLTSMVWQWGQFVDHDLGITESHEPHEAFPILVPEGDLLFDPFSTGNEMIFLFRSEYRESEDEETPREQINGITSWIDGSNVYGSDAETSLSLRTLSGGLMKTSAGDLLPLDEEGFFIAGDIRANEQNALTAMHTLFVREHNRIARRYSERLPHLSDEQVFVRARKRVVGIMQAITYNEWLPALLGDDAMSRYRGYRPNVFPNVSNVFTTTAFRFGHTMLPTELQRLDGDLNEIEAGHVALRDAFFNPQEIKDHGIDPYLRGLVYQQSQEIDPQITDEVRNFLFGPPGAGGFDLASLNIQRGRDHGIPDYNTVRVFFGLSPVTEFSEITEDPERQASLEQAYGSVDLIDPWVGMLCEDHVDGGSMGITAREIIVDQFEKLRDADRFWYELEMHPVDVAVIGATKLSNVIYRNTDVKRIPRNVFQFQD